MTNADQTNSKLLKQEYGRFITFYSYKGGVGRSMALANVGVLLAQWGYDVLMIDWDLEAPGLENYFKGYLNITQIQQNKGLIDLLSLRSRSELDIESREWQSYMKSVDLDEYMTPLSLNTTGNLSLLTAGCRDQYYEQKVRQFDYSEFYKEKAGSRFIEDLREIWQRKYDFILIDSRTGFTASSRICTVHLPDIMLLMFTPNQQSFNGVKKVAANAVRDQESEVLYTRFRLRTLPVPCRIENAETTLQDIWMKKIADESEPMLQWLPRNPDNDTEFIIKPEQLVNHIKIPYRTYLAYDEMLTVIERGTLDPVDLGYVYETLAAILANDLKRIQLLNGSRDNFIKRAKGALVEDLQELEESHKSLVKQINLQSEEKQKSEEENLHLKKQTRRVTYITVLLSLILTGVIVFFVFLRESPIPTEQVKYELFIKAVKDTSSNYDKYSEVNIVSLYKSYYTLDSAHKVQSTQFKAIMDSNMRRILMNKVNALGDLLDRKSNKEAIGYFSKKVQLDELGGIMPDNLLTDTAYRRQLSLILPANPFSRNTNVVELSGDSIKFGLKYSFAQPTFPSKGKKINVNLTFNYDLKVMALLQLDPAKWERKGFDYLLHKNVDLAISCFDNSDLSEANYHNAFEISNILQVNRQALEDTASSQWPLVYKHIVDSCRWKMPIGVEKRLKVLGKIPVIYSK
jgi:Mrp family chromosome partitioning ATPase